MIDHAKDGVVAAYKIYDHEGDLMAPEGTTPDETSYNPPRFSSGQSLAPHERPAVLNLELGNFTSTDGRPTLKRKAHNHLDEPLYARGARRRRLDNGESTAASQAVPVQASVSVLASVPSDPSLTSPSTSRNRLFDLPRDFKPANRSLRVPQPTLIVPPCPTHIELRGDFAEAMSSMAGLTYAVTRSLAHAVWDEMPKVRASFSNYSKAVHLADESWPKSSPILELEMLLKVLTSEISLVFAHSQRSSQLTTIDFVTIEQAFENRFETHKFIYGRRQQDQDVKNSVIIVDPSSKVRAFLLTAVQIA